MSTGSGSRLRVETIEGITVVHFVDHKMVTDETIQAINGELLDLLDQGGDKNLLLNFCDVQLMSSSALANLLHLERKLKARAGALKLCGLKPVQVELFRVTGLDRVFTIYADEQSALDSF